MLTEARHLILKVTYLPSCSSNGDARRRSCTRPAPRNHNAAVREGLLLSDLIVRPTSRIEFRNNVLTASVSFTQRHYGLNRTGNHHARPACFILPLSFLQPV